MNKVAGASCSGFLLPEVESAGAGAKCSGPSTRRATFYSSPRTTSCRRGVEYHLEPVVRRIVGIGQPRNNVMVRGVRQRAVNTWIIANLLTPADIVFGEFFGSGGSNQKADGKKEEDLLLQHSLNS